MSLKILAPLALVPLLAPAAASAADFCAGTSAELQAALDATAINGESDVIRVEPGTYSPPSGTAFHYDGQNEDHDLVISGGWRTVGIPPNVLPCLLRDKIDPRRTRIISGTPNGNLHVRVGQGSFLLEGFMISGGHSTSTLYPGGLFAAAGGHVTIRFNLLVGNETPGTTMPGALWVTTPATVDLVNNFFLGNSSTLFAGAAEVTGPTVRITHNGFVANSGGREALYLSTFNHIGVLTSNLFWNNGGGDLTLDSSTTANPLLVDNLVETLTQILSFIDPTSHGNIDSDPLFTGPDDCGTELGYELGAGSPAIDAGEPNPLPYLPSQDLLGHERSIGTRPDIGPLERRVAFCDGVESGDLSAWSVAQP